MQTQRFHSASSEKKGDEGTNSFSCRICDLRFETYLRFLVVSTSGFGRYGFISTPFIKVAK